MCWNTFTNNTAKPVDRKSTELLEKAIALENNPGIGRIEENLRPLGRRHRYILYYYTSRKAIKIIYFIKEQERTVYVTDFFPCESDENKINRR
jgi:hypothetical protein